MKKFDLGITGLEILEKINIIYKTVFYQRGKTIGFSLLLLE